MVPIKNQSLIYRDRTKRDKSSKKFRIIHFNDVYNIEGFQTEPVGGVARFASALDYFKRKNDSIILFSGDALSPSTLSLFYKGNQIIDCLNKLNVHAAAIGNHEFDMGLDVLESMIQKSNFPWLLSNVFDRDPTTPFISSKEKVIVTIKDIKIGIISLVEKEWVCSLSAISFDEIEFKPFIEEAKRLANELRNEDKVDLVLALTHMRWHNDEKLVKKVPEIDIILGGHDHEYEVKNYQVDGKNKFVLKSGADFRELSVLDIEFTTDKKFLIKKIKKCVIDSNINEREDIKQIVKNYVDQSEKMLDQELGIINVDLDGRHDTVRKCESNLGNFLCDIILSSVVSDCAILNGGSLRSDQVHKAGSFTRRDLRKILPFDSELVVVSVTGNELHQVLENCISKYEQVGGRFPQVSGLFFTYDIRKPPFQRIDPRVVKVQNEYLEMNKTYRLATNTFLKNVDETLKNSSVIISAENIPFLYTLVENYFKTINILKENKVDYNAHRSQIIPKVIINCLLDKYSHDPDIIPKESLLRSNRGRLTFRFVAKFVLKSLKARKVVLYKEKKMIKRSEKFKNTLNEYERKSLELAPEVENRSILIKSDQEFDSILNERKLSDQLIDSTDNFLHINLVNDSKNMLMVQ